MESQNQSSSQESQSKTESPPPLIKIERVFSLNEEEIGKTKKEEASTSVLSKNDDYLQAFSEAFHNFSKDITKKLDTAPNAQLSHHKLGSPSIFSSYQKKDILTKTNSNFDNDQSNGRKRGNNNGLLGQKRPRFYLDQFLLSPGEQESSFISQLQKLHSYTDDEQERSRKLGKYQHDSLKEIHDIKHHHSDKPIMSSENPYQVVNSNRGLPALIKFDDKISDQPQPNKNASLLEKYKKYLILQNREQHKSRVNRDEWKRKVLADYLAQLKKHHSTLNERGSVNLPQTSRYSTSKNYNPEVQSSIELANTDSIPKTLTDEKALQRRKKLHDMIEEIKRTSQPEKKDEVSYKFEATQKQTEDLLNNRSGFSAKRYDVETPIKYKQEEKLQLYQRESSRSIPIDYKEEERYSDSQQSSTTSFLNSLTGRVSPDDPDLYKPRTYKRLESGKPSALQKLEDKLSKESFSEDEGDSSEQKVLKLERKRYLSRIASYKSRKKRLEREEHLAKHVEGLKEEKIRLEMMRSFALKELQEVRTIIKSHLKLGCEDKQVVERLVYSLNNFS